MLWQNWYQSDKEFDGNYTELHSSHILQSLEQLNARILERFPESGLSSVAKECTKVAMDIKQLIKRLAHPIWFLRLLMIGTIVLTVLVTIGIVAMMMQLSSGINGWADILQTGEAGINELIFLAIALWFLASLETRAKRQAVLKSLHRLRSMAHVVDMHQLTKDPVTLLTDYHPTASSPKRTMTPYELTRYLDYCSELLSLISKLAALHAQKEMDSVVLDAVNDVESLAQALSGKIWQKLTILDKEHYLGK